LLYCTKRGPVTRGLDNIKKKRGEITTTLTNLHMKKVEDRKTNGSPVPATLKLK